ncbi:MAG TPA: hypothetical protein ENK14_09890 [Caldithrix sp.]|nr:hypothetical protein [Caldithrix sp.]
MNIFERHEIFEMEVLDRLKSGNLLQPLVFGGGSMLRLCFELNRYSVDLDFWFIKEVDVAVYFEKCRQLLQSEYEITDEQNKFHSLLFEIRSGNYLRRLKIEIRKAVKECDFQESIAWSRFSNKQVLLRTHTLEQSMKNKVEALINRNEIRDAYDIEFLLRKGISLPEMASEQRALLLRKINSYRKDDFRVKLGSVLEREMRDYYVVHGFRLLEEKLRQVG